MRAVCAYIRGLLVLMSVWVSYCCLPRFRNLKVGRNPREQPAQTGTFNLFFYIFSRKINKNKLTCSVDDPAIILVDCLPVCLSVCRRQQTRQRDREKPKSRRETNEVLRKFTYCSSHCKIYPPTTHRHFILGFFPRCTTLPCFYRRH